MDSITENYGTKLTHDAAKTLHISDSTLRRWCRELEAYGYEFAINDDEARLFREKDIQVLLHLKDLVQAKRGRLGDAAKDVTNLHSHQIQSESLPSIRQVESPNALAQQVKQEMIGLIELLQCEITVLQQNQHSLELQIQELKNTVLQLTQQTIHVHDPLQDKRDMELMYALREIHQSKATVAATRQRKWWKKW